MSLDPIEAELEEGLPMNVIEDDERNIIMKVFYIRLFTINYNFYPKFSRNQKEMGLKEDTALVSCIVNLHNVGTFNADTGFKVNYLNALKRMLEKF
ncbi:Chaperone DnaK [Gossypium australe]|uniref:Chaperone DnaK n=1 Tax=Gossypium australe TaxID=47621 RepID=A0A5B6X2F2_9ROSI|nr:Chaperone DnaK [Gossypium australe]